MDAGGVLKQARARAGLSQRKLAQQCGTSATTIADIETGRVSPTLRVFERLLAGCALELTATLEPLRDPLAVLVATYQQAPAVEQDVLARWAVSLDDRSAPGIREVARRGPVTWAFDGAAALRLQGYAAPLPSCASACLVVEWDEAARFWLRAVQASGVDPRERPFADWLGCELEQAELSLRGRVVHTLVGFAMIRLVARLPATTRIALSDVGIDVPVLRLDEVERAHPHHAAVLGRLRAAAAPGEHAAQRARPS